MELKEIIEKVRKKVEEAASQRAEISRRLSVNKRDKAAAEEAKAAALEAKDEQAYKDACRAIADSEAGIEFNTICLNAQRKKLFATYAENREIKQAMRKEAAAIAAEAFKEIEKACESISEKVSFAVEKLQAIDTMNQAWDDEVMKGSNPLQGNASEDKIVILNQFKGRAEATLVTVRNNLKRL